VADTKNVASVQVFLVPEGLPVLPLPEAPPLVPESPTDPFTISYFENEIEHIIFGDSPVTGTSDRLPSLMLCGRTISNEVLSPFGNLTGAPCVLHTAYDIVDEETGETNFVFFGGAAAGNHTTVAPSAKGILWLKR
jgi:hypothetical protein